MCGEINRISNFISIIFIHFDFDFSFLLWEWHTSNSFVASMTQKNIIKQRER